jgi:hypothetical protein
MRSQTKISIMQENPPGRGRAGKSGNVNDGNRSHSAFGRLHRGYGTPGSGDDMGSCAVRVRHRSPKMRDARWAFAYRSWPGSRADRGSSPSSIFWPSCRCSVGRRRRSHPSGKASIFKPRPAPAVSQPYRWPETQPASDHFCGASCVRGRGCLSVAPGALSSVMMQSRPRALAA